MKRILLAFLCLILCGCSNKQIEPKEEPIVFKDGDIIEKSYIYENYKSITDTLWNFESEGLIFDETEYNKYDLLSNATYEYCEDSNKYILVEYKTHNDDATLFMYFDFNDGHFMYLNWQTNNKKLYKTLQSVVHYYFYDYILDKDSSKFRTSFESITDISKDSLHLYEDYMLGTIKRKDIGYNIMVMTLDTYYQYYAK